MTSYYIEETTRGNRFAYVVRKCKGGVELGWAESREDAERYIRNMEIIDGPSHPSTNSN